MTGGPGVRPTDPVVGDEVRLTVQRETDVPQVVAAAHRFCASQGVSALLAAHVATAASELANNLWMHSRRGGQIALRRLRPPLHRPALQLCASDDGPGIADLAQALREGYSSAGGMGCGLPGVGRLMDVFEIQSSAEAGTRVCALKWLPAEAAAPRRRP